MSEHHVKRAFPAMCSRCLVFQAEIIRKEDIIRDLEHQLARLRSYGLRDPILDHVITDPPKDAA